MMVICEPFPNLRGRGRRAHFTLSLLAKRTNRPPDSEPAANRRSAAMSLGDDLGRSFTLMSAAEPAPRYENVAIVVSYRARR
jgi:hypothetical protein